MKEAKRLGAIPHDVKGVELGHHGKECSFETILKKYALTDDPALVLWGRIVNGADTDHTLYHQPEGPNLEAVAEASAISALGTITRSIPRSGSSTMRSTPTAKN